MKFSRSAMDGKYFVYNTTVIIGFANITTFLCIRMHIFIIKIIVLIKHYNYNIVLDKEKLRGANTFLYMINNLFDPALKPIKYYTYITFAHLQTP